VTDKARSDEPETAHRRSALCRRYQTPDLPGAEILDEQVENLYNSLYVKLADDRFNFEILDQGVYNGKMKDHTPTTIFLAFCFHIWSHHG
jgi:hypothetical protein